MEQLEKKLKEKEDVMYRNENIEKDLTKKALSLSKRINNIPFLNTYMNSRQTNYKNVNTQGGDSPTSKRYTFKGIETTNFNFNKWKKMSEPTNNISKMNNKFIMNAIANKNIIASENKFILDNSNNKTTNYKSNKSKSKIYYIKNRLKKSDTIDIDKSNDNDKKEIHNYKLINDDEYEKKLFENFKLEMESQRRAKKKIAKKIFLPPLTYCSLGNYKSSLNFHTEKRNNSKLKKSSIIESEKIPKSKGNSINNNSNISFVINNSFSANTSKIIMENEKSIHSNSNNRIKTNIDRTKSLTKDTNKKKNNLKIVQLYNIIQRKNKNKNKKNK
jgi:hypothetical protein